MSRWQDEVTAAEWDDYNKVALQAARRLGRNTSLGYEDYAAQVIEKLLLQNEKPANVDAWIRLTTKNLLIDRWRKVNARGGESERGMDTDDLDREIAETLMGPKTLFILKESINEVLGRFPEKHQRLAIMFAAGFEADEIAAELGYASPVAVLNQHKRMKEKVDAWIADGSIQT